MPMKYLSMVVVSVYIVKGRVFSRYYEIDLVIITNVYSKVG